MAKRRTIAELEAQLAAEIEKARAEISTLRVKANDAQAAVGALTRERDAMKNENNHLRDLLHDAETELARRAGYMQAVEDREPQPERKPPSRALSLDQAKPQLDHFSYDESAARPRWWHR